MNTKTKTFLHLACAVILLLLPLVLSKFGLKLTTEIFIMSIFVLSLGLIIGYAGLVSLGHAAFFGIGVYTVALLGKYVSSSYVLILAAIVFAAVTALLTGMLFIRSSGAYFLMITLAFSQMLFVLAYKLKDITGGADGMPIRATLDLGFGAIDSVKELYYFMAIAFMISYALLYMFIKSPAGKAVVGVKENEHRMKALGYPTRSYKLLAYTISGGFAGFAGALYAYFNHFVSTNVLAWQFSGQVMVMCIVGGVSVLFGPPIGAALFIVLQSYVSSYTERWPIIMGIIFIAFVLSGRGGIAELLIWAWNKVFGNKAEDKPTVPPPSAEPEGPNPKGVASA